jgi:hypothetical protein
MRNPAGAHRIRRAGEKGSHEGQIPGFGPSRACGELPKISGE